MSNKERLSSTFPARIRIDSESRHGDAMAARLLRDLSALSCRLRQAEALRPCCTDKFLCKCTIFPLCRHIICDKMVQHNSGAIPGPQNKRE